MKRHRYRPPVTQRRGSSAPASETLALAFEHHRAGRFRQAEILYRQVLQAEPDHPDALHLLGVLAHQVGFHTEAAELIGRALLRKPGAAEFHNNFGNARWGQGRIAEAEASYRQALALRPSYVEAEHNLGNALAAQGRIAEAEASCRRALALRPDYVEVENSLGNALARQGRDAEAETSYRRALGLRPDFAEAHANLANVLWVQGKAVEAEASARRALALKPDHAEAHNNLGNALAAQARLEEAEASFRRALALKPDYPEAHNNLGTALSGLGRFAEAEASCRRALVLRPEYAEACNNVGSALWILGRSDEAIAHYRQAVTLRPGYADAHNNLGQALTSHGRPAEAAASCRRALALRPDYPEAHANLGNALAAQGTLVEAIASFERAVALRPDYAEAHSNLIFALDFDPRASSARAFEERRRWNFAHARRHAARALPHANEPSPERRLRIGYVSADFRRHSASAVFGPVVLAHDRERFEVACYAGVKQPDERTERFREAASLWRSTVGVSDERLAEIIREDRIDILVDLAGHSEGNRLLAFARKPAPIQVTAWGHALGTGLDAVDYFFADPVTVPPEMRRDFTETVVDLPSFVAYDPPAPAPDVVPLPALRDGRITFGSFNRPAKVTEEILALWAEILGAVEDSRLLMKFIGLDDPVNQARILDVLGARGVAPDRVAFLGGSNRWEHLEAYRRVDLALDTFPHGGGVTALDGLWMGVPMVTLVGERIPSRMGASFLTTLGLPELIAASPGDYVRRAVQVAGDVAGLARRRAGLRGRMTASILCDARGYCGEVESAYRAMWRRWCAGRQARSARPSAA